MAEFSSAELAEFISAELAELAAFSSAELTELVKFSSFEFTELAEFSSAEQAEFRRVKLAEFSNNKPAKFRSDHKKTQLPTTFNLLPIFSNISHFQAHFHKFSTSAHPPNMTIGKKTS